MNRAYETLNRLHFLKTSYLNKFLFIAFVGINIPFIAIIVLMIYNDQVNKFSIFTVLLLFTLLAAGLIFFSMRKLFAPLVMAGKVLEDSAGNKLFYSDSDDKDKVGRLIKAISNPVHHIDPDLEEKEQFTELLSHNMRIPFAQIKALTDVLVKQTNLKDNGEVSLINLICEHQLHNSEELFKNLNFHSNESEKAVVNLKELTKKLVLIARSQLQKKDLEVVIEFDDFGTSVSTEEQKVSLVLENILNNAIKFSFPGRKIYITGKQKRNYYTISVKDQGIGFPMDYRDKIFLPNANIGRVGTMGEPSNGIGLSLSKKNIQKLGGDIRAFSDGDHKGAEFVVFISVDQAN